MIRVYPCCLQAIKNSIDKNTLYRLKTLFHQRFHSGALFRTLSVCNRTPKMYISLLTITYIIDIH